MTCQHPDCKEKAEVMTEEGMFCRRHADMDVVLDELRELGLDE